MPLVARIDDTDAFLRWRVRVAVFHHQDGGFEVRRVDRELIEPRAGDTGLRWAEHSTLVTRSHAGRAPEAEADGPWVDPYALDVSEDVARAVYEALRARFEGERAPGDAQALRRDLDAERARTDQLLTHILQGNAAALTALLAPPTK